MSCSSLTARCFVLIAVLTAGIATALGQSFEVFPEVESYGKAIDARADLTFGYHGQQQLDLYLPAGATRAPVVVCWFGGAFWGSDRKQLEKVAAYFAARGIAAVTPDYTLGKKDGSVSTWPQSVYDAKAAVRYVRAHAAELKVDPDRIAALGYSSGAYLATMVGVTPNLQELEGNGGSLSTPSRVAAVVGIAGVYDRRRDLGLPLALLGKGYEEKYDLRVAASPIIYVHSRTVPIYLLHGDHDSVADVSSARQMAEALREAKVPHVLRIVDAGHFPFTPEEVKRIADWLAKVL